jgi:glycosyltransferase involved in cell wall biosynthesis
MSAPLVTVVIPCYNAELWISDAIESALNQTHLSTEIVVVDDGSTDGSLKALEPFRNRIRVETGPNRGGCAARNLGVGLARGGYIQFLDADDMLVPTCIEAKLDCSTLSDVVPCCDVQLIDDGTGPPRHDFWHIEHYPLATMLRRGSPQTASPLHNRQRLLQVGGFREQLPCAQEYDLHLRLAITFGVEFRSNGQVGVLIRPRPESLSRQAGPRMYDVSRQVLLDACALLEERNELTDDYKAAVAQHLTRLAKRRWRLGDHERAARFANEARRLSRQWYRGCYRGRAEELLAGTIGFTAYEVLNATLRRRSV